MKVSITTNFVKNTGTPEPFLRQIADAGFTHVHWGHQWNTDFLYSRAEVAQIRKWLNDCRLKLLDLHGSAGIEKNWTSLLEDTRQAGMELVKNRIEMAHDLDGDVVIMHAGDEPEGQAPAFGRQLRRSLDELEPYARERGIRIAFENVGAWSTTTSILADYSPDYIGVCYDSGHGNLSLGWGGLEEIAAARNRLISVHLNDNDGNTDQHKLLFTGTVPWPRLAGIMADSSYAKCMSMEVGILNSGITDESAFLAQALESGAQFSRMIEEQKSLRNQKAKQGHIFRACCPKAPNKFIEH